MDFKMFFEHFIDYWPGLLAVLSLVLPIICSVHVILYKKDSRAAISWVGIVWLVPLLGCFLYYIFGINRVRRFAKEVRNEVKNPSIPVYTVEEDSHRHIISSQFFPLKSLGKMVTGRDLTFNNHITPLFNGDEAYPEMLLAIDQAKLSATLSSYIFDNDRVGHLFIEALKRAIARKVKVRVLIDDIGLRYSFRPVLKKLKKAKIPVARFLGALRPMTFPHINLRKHRKILIIDGKIAFTGGMNIREGHKLSLLPRHPVLDLHFKITGSVVRQLQEVFTHDWFFTTKESLLCYPWFTEDEATGDSVARVVTDGPDEDLFKLPMIIEGAMSCAKKSIWIMTPYFLPEMPLTRALQIAASKGIKVNIVLPSQSNIALVQWASHYDLKSLIDYGCQVWHSPPPFDHTKLIVIDDEWILFGSANLDPRSLRLNFEMNVECYNKELGLWLRQHAEERMKVSKKVTADFLQQRATWIKLRDGTARLFSPYL
jgi:cardiolipin synthase